MKKLFVALLLSVSTSIFSQGNFNGEWQSPAGLTFKGLGKLNQGSNILYFFFIENVSGRIRIYNGATHTEYYNWILNIPTSSPVYHSISGAKIGSNMFRTGENIFQTTNFDANNDGFNDIIITGNAPFDSISYIVDPIFTGNILYQTSNDIYQAIDVDDDGFVELLEVTGTGPTYGGIKIVSTPAQTVSVSNQNEIVKNYDLKQNYPNPFNPNTVIEYDLNKKSDVKVIIYDILGKEIETLVDQSQIAGTYKLSLQGSELTSGTYFYSLIVDGVAESKKMILIK